MRTIYQDVRYGLRVLLGSPGFTAVAVLTLAIGLGVNATVFGWLDAVLLNPFPGAQRPSELVLLETSSPNRDSANISFTDYRDYRDHLKLVSGLAVARITPLTVGFDGRGRRTWGELVSANYFDVLGVRARLGRTFSTPEAGDQPGAHPVIVISDRFWRAEMHGDPEVVGRTLRVNRQNLTIIGVAPPEFRGTLAGVSFDLWVPVTMANLMGTGSGTLTYRGTRDLTTAIGRLAPGASIAAASAEAAALAARLSAQYPRTNGAMTARIVRVRQGQNGAQPFLVKPLGMLAGVAMLLLLIVCANVGNLLLARAVSRNREFGIRLAMGAGRWRLVRQLLTETLLLASAGAVLGLFLSAWMSQSIDLLLPPSDGLLSLNPGFSLRSAVFTLLITMLTTLVAGTAPALLSARSDLNETLKDCGRGGQAGRHSHRLRSTLVVSEVALATVALLGAGLFYRSFRNANAIHPGFDTSNTLVAQFYLSAAGYSANEQRQFCRSLRERLEAVPAVTAVSYSDFVPLGLGPSPGHRLEVEGHVPARGQDMFVHRAFVPPGYFDLMQIRMLEGRDFTEKDEAGAPMVILVNEAFRKRFFSASSTPVGRRVRVENKWATVVGVVKDSRYHSPMEAPLPFFYVPFRQEFAPGLNFAFFVKTAGDPLAIADTLRREALSLNQDAVFTSRTFADAITTALAPLRLAANLLTVLGGACLFLAAIGLYSVMSYSITQRTQELGIRMAMGARPAAVIGLVLRDGMKLTLIGLVAGLSLAGAFSHLLTGMLVNVSPDDPATLAFAAVTLLAISTLATWVPARRATKLDPMVALRSM